MNPQDADIIFAGGGLASCLTALRIAEAHRHLSVMIVDSSHEICGNHTWSFHLTDIESEDLDFLTPMIAYQWPGQRVIFPGYTRKLTTSYASLTAQSVRARVHDTSNISVRVSTPIGDASADGVTTATGERLSAHCVFDGRGYQPNKAQILGFQKFVGLELRLRQAHWEDVPTIMDASVDQLDGYRFVYVLPLDKHTLLVEDTRYSDHSELDNQTLIEDIHRYVEAKGWEIAKVIRRENGVLPISLGHDADRFWQGIDGTAIPIGLRAGLFQPTTGYSLPNTIRLATKLAALAPPYVTGDLRERVRSHVTERVQRQSYYRFLNRMLFKAAIPPQRWKVLARFYTLPQGLIERFYAEKLNIADRARILVGKPPVPISAALKCISEKSVYEQKEAAA